jgi:hypothetical protein
MPCWPPIPALSLNQKTRPLGIPNRFSPISFRSSEMRGLTGHDLDKGETVEDTAGGVGRQRFRNKKQPMHRRLILGYGP